MKTIVRILPVVILLGISNNTYADQLQILTKKEAKKARKVIKKNKTVYLLCLCCGEVDEMKAEVEKVELVKDGDGDYEVCITYNGKREVIDLAYIWVDVDGERKTIGEVLGLDHDPCRGGY